MLGQFLANIAIACLWVFLNGSYTMPTFVAGYLMGMLLLYLFGRSSEHTFYMARLWRVIKLLFIFLREMVIACFQVFVLVIAGTKKINPGIIEYQTELETPLQVTLLANMITLTPGTITMEISEDNKLLFIHVLKLDNADAIRDGIRRNFEEHIKEVSA